METLCKECVGRKFFIIRYLMKSNKIAGGRYEQYINVKNTFALELWAVGQ